MNSPDFSIVALFNCIFETLNKYIAAGLFAIFSSFRDRNGKFNFLILLIGTTYIRRENYLVVETPYIGLHSCKKSNTLGLGLHLN